MFSIVVDGTADIPPNLRDDINVVPLYVIFKGRSYKATEKLLKQDIENMLVPGEISTSMPTINDFIEVFQVLSKPILVIHVSKNISGTYRAIRASIEELGYQDRIKAFDTLTTGPGIGVYAWLAHLLREKGKTIDEVIEKLTYLRDSEKSKTYAVIGNIRFTVSGGRVRDIAGIAMKAMRLIVSVSPDRDGNLRVIGKSFGRKKALRLLRKNVVSFLESVRKPIIGISHAWCEEDAYLLKDYLHALRPDAKIFMTPINATLIAHGGKGTIAASVLDVSEVI